MPQRIRKGGIMPPISSGKERYYTTKLPFETRKPFWVVYVYRESETEIFYTVAATLEAARKRRCAWLDSIKDCPTPKPPPRWKYNQNFNTGGEQ